MAPKAGAWLQRRWPVVLSSLLLFVGSVWPALEAPASSSNSGDQASPGRVSTFLGGLPRLHCLQLIVFSFTGMY